MTCSVYILQEKYEKELIDARFRELKLAGEADTLDKVRKLEKYLNMLFSSNFIH